MTVLRLAGRVDGPLEDGRSPDAVYEQYGRQLAGRLAVDEQVDRALMVALRALRRDGWTVLRTDLEGPSPQAELTAIALGCWFGTPTRTNPRKSTVAWPITPNAATARTTFSQTSDEAAFHTDTQYFEVPEKLFCLVCMHADVPGLGTNQLVDGREALRVLRDREPRLAAALARPFPFRVPTIFTADQQDDTVEITWAPVAGPSIFRYRYDTLIDALKLPGVRIDDRQREALEALREVIGELPAVEHHLADGEVLLVDNHRMLHARTSFADPRRFLYRVRMHAD